MVYVGRFTEEDCKNKIDKKAIEEKMKETGLQYVESKIVCKNKKAVALDIWVCNADEFTL